MEVVSIGTVKSPVVEAIDEGWGDVESSIVLDAAFARGLEGIGSFSHVMVVYWMHEAAFEAARDLVRRPRGRADMPEAGIFAQRARHRPNPIGITAVELLRREGGTLVVRGLDAIDGTPVLDVKPYVPVYDRVDGATIPAWMDELMRGYF